MAFVALWIHSPILLAVGLAMCGCLALATLRRQRVPTAIVAFLLTFGPWDGFFIVGVVYAGLAFGLAAAGRQKGDDRRSPRR